MRPDLLIFCSSLERYMFEYCLEKQGLAQLLGTTNRRPGEVLNGKWAVNLDLGRHWYTQLQIPAEFVLMHA